MDRTGTLRRLGRSVSRLARTRVFRILSPPAALAIALFLVRGQLGQLEGGRVAAALAATPTLALGLAVACTVANFACLAVVEVLALRFIGRPQPAARAAIAAFAANAIQNAIGFGAVTGAATRLRAYAFAKLEAGDVARLVLTLSAANILSGLIAEGLGLAASLPRRLAHHPSELWIAAPALALILVPTAAWFRLRRGGDNGGLGARWRAVALAAALGDWIFSAAALFFLSARHAGAFFRFLAVFSLGSLAASVHQLSPGRDRRAGRGVSRPRREPDPRDLRGPHRLPDRLLPRPAGPHAHRNSRPDRRAGGPPGAGRSWARWWSRRLKSATARLPQVRRAARMVRRAGASYSYTPRGHQGEPER